MTAQPPLTRGLARAATLACPRCGSRSLFRRWVVMEERCPRCQLHFEQSQGYWLGSVMVNTGATEGLFLVLFVVGMMVSWPNVPWTALLVLGVVVVIIFPVLFHPFSRTLWVATERHVSGWQETVRPRPVPVVANPEGE